MFVLEIITPKNQCVIEWFGENTDALPAVQLGTAETGLPIGESNDAFFNSMVYIRELKNHDEVHDDDVC